MRWHSNILDVHLVRAADCYTDHYVLVMKVRERLAVSKETMLRFHIERFSFKKLNEIEDKDHYHVEVSKRFQLWKFWMLRWVLLVLGKLLDEISKFQPKTVYVIMN